MKTLQEANLNQFTGTEQYWQWSPLFRFMVLTDGAQFVAKNGGTHGAFWLMDAIASYQPKLAKHKDTRLRDMQFWKLEVKNGQATLTCRADSGVKPAVTQKIEYTDFNLPEIELWVAPCGPEGKLVIMLKSEY